MSSGRSSDIYASAPVCGLLGEEVRALRPRLQHCGGDHGLWLGAHAEDTPPALPLLARWTQLYPAGDLWCGSVLARFDEPLPFADESFSVVVVRHCLERNAAPQAILAEAVRVLAPAGLLAVTGVHPVSLWAPWLRAGARLDHCALQLPLQLSEWLRRASLQTERVERIGRWLPRAAGTSPAHGSLLGGGYVLLARKQQEALTPLWRAPRSMCSPLDPTLAPARRLRA